MDVSILSNRFFVRKLEKKDVKQIYTLSCGNRIFYEYHPPFVTEESILEDMEALPPGKNYEDKYYIGFFDGEELTAMMDLIHNYPEERVAFIGLFMVDQKYQGKGLGSQIICDCLSGLEKCGYEAVRLGVDLGNPQSLAFWRKNGFRIMNEDKYILMERKFQ